MDEKCTTHKTYFDWLPLALTDEPWCIATFTSKSANIACVIMVYNWSGVIPYLILCYWINSGTLFSRHTSRPFRLLYIYANNTVSMGIDCILWNADGNLMPRTWIYRWNIIAFCCPIGGKSVRFDCYCKIVSTDQICAFCTWGPAEIRISIELSCPWQNATKSIQIW